MRGWSRSEPVAEPYRVACYYAPETGDPLWRAGARWLGRDAATGAEPAASAPDLPDLTTEPRGYGFHATLKPPMRLAGPATALQEAARALAAATAPFSLPALRVVDMKGFLALGLAMPCPPLRALADACVMGLDPYRAPASAGELARRRRAGLSPAQEAHLLRWGYPYVLDAWIFHMTLTRRLAPAESVLVRPRAEAAFAGLLGPRLVTSLCLFAQPAPGAPFVITARLPLRG